MIQYKSRQLIIHNILCIIMARKEFSDVPWKPAKMIRFLKQNGFVEIPKGGGHRQFYNPANGRMTEVPMHNKELRPGTEKIILKEAGLRKYK